MVEELQEIFRGPDHARAFFHHRDPAGPQHGPGLRERVEVHLDIEVLRGQEGGRRAAWDEGDRKSTRLNSSHGYISYAVFCLKKKKKNNTKEELTHHDE